MSYQVVEKSGFGVDWAMVRYEVDALSNIPTIEAANEFAKNYLTKRNFNNALTREEKFRNLEAFMVTDQGFLLGELDGTIQYLTYPKDVFDPKKGQHEITHQKGEKILDRKWHQLNSMVEVAVRAAPGQR